MGVQPASSVFNCREREHLSDEGGRVMFISERMSVWRFALGEQRGLSELQAPANGLLPDMASVVALTV